MLFRSSNNCPRVPAGLVALFAVLLALFITFFAFRAADACTPRPSRALQPSGAAPQSTPPQTSPSFSLQSTPPPATPPQNPPPAPPPTPPSLIVVLDPAHGGTDYGARGANGLVEKDLTLELARATQAELQRQGVNAVLTRDGDDNPSFDDRATLANTPRLAIFVTFHVSSTGKSGTARAYFDRFPTSNPGSADPLGTSSPNPIAPPSPTSTSLPPSTSVTLRPPDHRFGHTLTPWSQGQRNFLASSQRLADLIQAGLAQNLRGSPDKSSSFAIRDLRSVAAPAVAVELSSVSSLDRTTAERLAGPLAAGVARGIVQFRSAFERQRP